MDNYNWICNALQHIDTDEYVTQSKWNLINMDKYSRVSLDCDSILRNVISKIRYPNGVRYFIIKVNKLAMIDISITKKTWIFSTDLQEKFNQVLKDGSSPILVFTVNGSEKFQGIAEFVNVLRYVDDLQGYVCDLRWISKMDIAFHQTRHLTNAFNGYRRLHSCQSGQELDPVSGGELLKLFVFSTEEHSADMHPPSTSDFQRGRPIVKTNK